jgi:hypothetical protein
MHRPPGAQATAKAETILMRVADDAEATTTTGHATRTIHGDANSRGKKRGVVRFAYLLLTTFPVVVSPIELKRIELNVQFLKLTPIVAASSILMGS